MKNINIKVGQTYALTDNTIVYTITALSRLTVFFNVFDTNTGSGWASSLPRTAFKSLIRSGNYCLYLNGLQKAIEFKNEYLKNEKLKL